MSSPPAGLITRAEAARRMGVSVRTVERRLAAGELRVVATERLGGVGHRYRLLSADEVHRYITGADPGQYELDLPTL